MCGHTSAGSRIQQDLIRQMFSTQRLPVSKGTDQHTAEYQRCTTDTRTKWRRDCDVLDVMVLITAMGSTGFARQAPHPRSWHQRRLLRSSQPRPNLSSLFGVQLSGPRILSQKVTWTADTKQCVWRLQQITQRKSRIDTNTRSRHTPKRFLLSKKKRRCHTCFCNTVAHIYDRPQKFQIQNDHDFNDIYRITIITLMFLVNFKNVLSIPNQSYFQLCTGNP